MTARRRRTTIEHLRTVMSEDVSDIETESEDDQPPERPSTEISVYTLFPRFAAKMLGIFYIFTGLIKLLAWSRINGAITRSALNQFIIYSENFPLAIFGFLPDPETYMFTIGCIEMSFGAVLGFGGHLPSRKLASLGLAVIMVGATLTYISMLELRLFLPLIFLVALIWIYLCIEEPPRTTKGKKNQ
ncbi:unnamed protein product [Owenia fusiformis]|uniref:Uncharacterized protein n=1 Tax=Owenia fusiformis TaxID=6347 RepID=A0A8J1TEQ5_OWEFU|nr:unnamed protein product [Owenia fusiformis]